jgi:hypothetical protein
MEGFQQQKTGFQQTNTGWWLTYPSKKYELVSWDDEIPNIGKIKFKFQTTNQININFGESRRIPGFCLPIFQLTQKLVVSV